MAAHAVHDEPQSPAYRVTRHEIYEVVHEPRVVIRSAPSLEAPIVGSTPTGKNVVAVRLPARH